MAASWWLGTFRRSVRRRAAHVARTPAGQPTWRGRARGPRGMPQRRRQPQNNSAAAVRMARHARVQPLRPCPETPWSVCHSCRSSRIHALLCHDIRSQGFMPSVIPAHYGNPFVGAVRRPGSCVASAMTSHLRTPSVSSVRRRPALVEIFAGVVRPELAVYTAASHEKASSPTAVVRRAQAASSSHAPCSALALEY